ncbi:MAG: hypothetical protein IKA86_07075 [Paraprevotella sp.]|nr:hypothetical protein [Paraprevotella sp.]
MKKIFTLLLCYASLSVSAQYLPNGDFSSWKTSCGSTEAFGTGSSSSPKTGEMRQRPGVEPTEWNGSSINQYVMLGVEKELVFNESNTVKMVNTYVGINLGFTKIGSVAPGFITLGTPWVYAESTVSKCDGGTYGGVSFTNKPDAITGKFKRTDSNAENSHIIVYTWDGTFTSNIGSKSSPNQARNNVDRAVYGKTDPTTSGNLIAYCDYAFTSTTNSDWETITVPLTYTDHGQTNAPTMMNVVISAGDYWTRANMIENTTLYADDVQFIYNSSLSDLKFNDTTISGFAKDTYEYTIDDGYTDGCITFTKDCVGGDVEGHFEPSSNSYIITVEGDDIKSNPSNTHTYTVKFTKVIINDGDDINEVGHISKGTVVLNRKFKAGWNTVCLPFPVTAAKLGTSVTTYKLSTPSGDAITFSKTTSNIAKNTPFLANFPSEVNSITFTSRTINEDKTPLVQTCGDWTFTGSYEPSISMEGKWGVVNDGSKVRKGGAGSTLKSTRAYLEYNGTANVNEMRIIIDGEETTITEIDGMPVGNFDVYNLQGVRVRQNVNSLDGLNKGIYIVNGKKHIVK